MPLYVGDYLADTSHLSTAEHGAYLLLIMHYWRSGSLPADDLTLSRIARMSRADWRKARSVISAFFQEGWKHKRIEFELTKAAKISESARCGGKASGEARKNKNVTESTIKTNDRSTTVQRLANDQPTVREPLHSPSQRKKDSEAYASAAGAAPEPVNEEPKAKLFRIGKTVLVSFGVAEKRTGSLIGQWLKTRDDPEGLLAAIQYARDQNVAEPVAYISTLLSKGSKNGSAQQSLGDVARELAAKARDQERAAGIFRPDDPLRNG